MQRCGNYQRVKKLSGLPPLVHYVLLWSLHHKSFSSGLSSLAPHQGTFLVPRLLSRISGELQEFYLSDRAYLLSSADLRKWRVSRGPKNDCQRKVGDEVVSDNRGLHGSARGFKMENESLVERHIDG
uniref:Uncharacterized protein n=1 Tax=Kalanchoe fedtschenkoi TaxID=63787 RepID=A0A7N0T8E1_KALFE